MSVAAILAAGIIAVYPGKGSPIAQAIVAAQPHDTVVIHAGVYREPLVAINKPLVVIGNGWPVLDGEGRHGLLLVTADDVTVRGLVASNVGSSFVEDRAAIRAKEVRGCRIEDNRVENAFFGIYLDAVTDCLIRRNTIAGRAATEAASGNGIHLWTSRRITVVDNRVSGHRDGIYFEFVHNSDIEHNVSERNLRYGLHFMFSDDCEYIGNTFAQNGSGVAVMFTKHVTMRGNRFVNNWGPAAYGLLLKEISDSRLESNTFDHNTTGLMADGANRLRATGNAFVNNGWAVRLEASTLDGRFERNNFVGNTLDVATNSSAPSTTFVANYWQSYEGYDLNRDGTGDVPYHPVRLFAMLVERSPQSLILMHSPLVDLLDALERALPALTPASVVDASPSMKPIR